MSEWEDLWWRENETDYINIVNLPEGIRIQKFLGARGVGSRRAVEDLICAKKIRVNGQYAILGQQVTEADRIEVDGKLIDQKPEPKVWYAFYKPIGVESTCALPKHEKEKTLRSFRFGDERVFPVGRLDKDSEGLILLTNDGIRANELMHPRYEHKKEYEVRVHKPIKGSDLNRLRKGIALEGYTTAPAEIERMGDAEFRIILHEGKNRQIRKMCAACGFEVTSLKRIRIESILLGDLKPGEWRSLDVSETL